MKRFYFLLIVLFLAGCSSEIKEIEERIENRLAETNTNVSFFQLKRDAYYIYQWNKDETFRDEINEFKRLDNENFPEKGKILFTGSSSIRFWDSLKKDMKPLKVLNRGLVERIFHILFITLMKLLSHTIQKLLSFFVERMT